MHPGLRVRSNPGAVHQGAAGFASYREAQITVFGSADRHNTCRRSRLRQNSPIAYENTLIEKSAEPLSDVRDQGPLNVILAKRAYLANPRPLLPCSLDAFRATTLRSPHDSDMLQASHMLNLTTFRRGRPDAVDALRGARPGLQAPSLGRRQAACKSLRDFLDRIRCRRILRSDQMSSQSLSTTTLNEG